MFKDYDNYIASIKMGKMSEHTRRSYISTLDRFVNHFSLESAEELNVLTSDDMREYLKELSASGLSESSVNTHIRIIKIFVNWMKDNKKITNSPFDGVKNLAEGEKDVEIFFTIEERDAMLINCTSPMKRLMLAILFFCGLRREEITDILVSDLNPNERTLLIHGKGNKQVKQEFISPTVVRLYNDYMKNRKSDSRYLFSTRKVGFGKDLGYHKLTGGSILNIVRASALKAGIDPEKVAKAGAHTTRRSCACHLALLGVNDFQIQAHMRHEQISTTQRYVAPARKLLAAKAATALPEPIGLWK